MAKTPHSQCWGLVFGRWLGTKSYMIQLKFLHAATKKKRSSCSKEDLCTATKDQEDQEPAGGCKLCCPVLS